MGFAENEIFERRLNELGMDYAGSIDVRNADNSYYVTYKHERCFLEMALKKGNSREPRYCMRIYMFWDKKDRCVVIGSLPKHLSNSIS
jgi:hypothetical protein